MRLLSRYLLRQLAAPFLFALSALTSILLLNQVAKRFPDLVGKGLPTGVIIEVLLLSLPFIIALTLPMAILVAVLYGFSHLAADNEITAMRANGISVAQMLRPVLLAGTVIAALNFVFIDQVLPRSNARLRDLTLDIGRKKPTFRLAEQVVNGMPPTQYWLRAARIEQYTGRLRNVTIYDLSQPDARRIIVADSGIMGMSANQQDVELRLFTGKVNEYRQEEPGVVRVTSFTTNTVRARDVANELQLGTVSFDRGDREMTTCEMIDRARFADAWAERARHNREENTRRDLRSILRLVPETVVTTAEPELLIHCGPWRRVESFLGRFIFPDPAEAQATPFALQDSAAAPAPGLPGTGVVAPAILGAPAEIAGNRERQLNELRQANAFNVEIHKKFTISVACLNFVLIGIALALRFPRGGMGLVLGGSLVIFAFFYISLTAGEGLADRNLTTPVVAMWFPNLILGVAGLAGIRIISRESGSTRGGDLADMAEMLFGWLKRRRVPK